MLRNLKEIHRAQEDWQRLIAVQDRLVILLPDAWAEYRDRGLAHAEQGHTALAVDDLETYLVHAQDALDIDAIADRVARPAARTAVSSTAGGSAARGCSRLLRRVAVSRRRTPPCPGRTTPATGAERARLVQRPGAQHRRPRRFRQHRTALLVQRPALPSTEGLRTGRMGSRFASGTATGSSTGCSHCRTDAHCARSRRPCPPAGRTA